MNSRPILLRFTKYPKTVTALSLAQIKDSVMNLGIKIENDEIPLVCWIKQMHINNYIAYEPGYIDEKIMAEIITNPDLRRYFYMIGGKIIDEDEV